MKIYRKIVDLLNRFMEIIGMLLLVVMVLVIFYHVIMRYVFNNTPSWSEEVCRLCMVYFSYVGFILGVKEKLHICIEMFVSKLPRKVLFVIDFIDNIAIAVLGFLMTRYGIELISRVSNSRYPATKLPFSMLYVMIPIAGAMSIFIIIEQSIDHVIKGVRGEDSGV